MEAAATPVMTAAPLGRLAAQAVGIHTKVPSAAKINEKTKIEMKNENEK